MLLDEERAGAARAAGRDTLPRRRALTAGLAAPHPGLWALIAVIVTIDAAGLAIAGVGIAAPGLVAVTATVVALLAAALVCSAVRPEPKLRAMALSSAYLLAFTASVAVLHVLAAMPALPLADGALARIEAALGFDGAAYLAFLADHPRLAHGLALAYHSSGPQIGLVVVALGGLGRAARLWTFARLFSVSLLACVILSALVPAAGTYAHHAPGRIPAGHLETVGAVWHLDVLRALREGGLDTIALSEIRGLVTFPSFHACLAVLTAWALAPLPVIGPLAVLLNAAIVVAAIGAGGHYLPDILAGAGLAGLLLLRHQRNRHVRRRSLPAPPAGAPAFETRT